MLLGGRGDSCSIFQDRFGGRSRHLKLVALDLVTFNGGRCVPTDSCATVEGSSDCRLSSSCNLRLTVERIGGDRAP